mmetsp:Transcript_3447/g.7530  ORF Transcript_3447/g.7530 Transcript_3447/m.7530 type:complete len:267 (-) Transcript_3447:231-1031(-)
MAHDLDQSPARTVEIHQGFPAFRQGIRVGVRECLAGVLFQLDPLDAKGEGIVVIVVVAAHRRRCFLLFLFLLGRFVGGHGLTRQHPVSCQRPSLLRDLVSQRQVGVKIVFSFEPRQGRQFAFHSPRRKNGRPHGFDRQPRQNSRNCHVQWPHRGIWFVGERRRSSAATVLDGASGKELCADIELCMDFHPDHRLEPGFALERNDARVWFDRPLLSGGRDGNAPPAASTIGTGASRRLRQQRRSRYRRVPSNASGSTTGKGWCYGGS